MNIERKDLTFNLNELTAAVAAYEYTCFEDVEQLFLAVGSLIGPSEQREQRVLEGKTITENIMSVVSSATNPTSFTSNHRTTRYDANPVPRNSVLQITPEICKKLLKAERNKKYCAAWRQKQKENKDSMMEEMERLRLENQHWQKLCKSILAENVELKKHMWMTKSNGKPL